MTQNQKRTDPHTDVNIRPADYTFLLAFAHGNSSEPSWNINCEMSHWVLGPDGHGHEVKGRPHSSDTCCVVRVNQTQDVFSGGASEGSSSACGTCGSWFRYGVALRHDPSGQVLYMGHECADKYLSLREDAELARYKAEMAEKRTKAGRERRLLKAYEAFHAANPWFTAARDLAKAVPATEERTRRAWAAPIILDMDARVRNYGRDLSERQVAFARKLAKAVTEGPAPEEPKVDAPEGRQVITGQIVSVKLHENDYGTRVVMTVKVETPEGRWLTWGTVPSSVESEVGYSKWEELKGREITFTATVSRSDKDSSFSFFKRPAKATLRRYTVEEAEAEAWASKVDRDHEVAEAWNDHLDAEARKEFKGRKLAELIEGGMDVSKAAALVNSTLGAV